MEKKQEELEKQKSTALKAVENVIGQNTKNVNPEGELVQVAKKIGISFAE